LGKKTQRTTNKKRAIPRPTKNLWKGEFGARGGMSWGKDLVITWWGIKKQGSVKTAQWRRGPQRVGQKCEGGEQGGKKKKDYISRPEIETGGGGRKTMKKQAGGQGIFKQKKTLGVRRFGKRGRKVSKMNEEMSEETSMREGGGPGAAGKKNAVGQKKRKKLVGGQKKEDRIRIR